MNDNDLARNLRAMLDDLADEIDDDPKLALKAMLALRPLTADLDRCDVCFGTDCDCAAIIFDN